MLFTALAMSWIIRGGGTKNESQRLRMFNVRIQMRVTACVSAPHESQNRSMQYTCISYSHTGRPRQWETEAAHLSLFNTLLHHLQHTAAAQQGLQARCAGSPPACSSCSSCHHRSCTATFPCAHQHRSLVPMHHTVMLIRAKD